VRLSGDAIINRHDQLNRNGIRAIACAGSIISWTGVQGVRVFFNARIGVSIIAISFIRLLSFFLSGSHNSPDDIAYYGRELRRCAIKPRFIEYTRDEVISVTLTMVNFHGKYVRQSHTRLNCLVEVAAWKIRIRQSQFSRTYTSIGDERGRSGEWETQKKRGLTTAVSSDRSADCTLLKRATREKRRQQVRKRGEILAKQEKTIEGTQRGERTAILIDDLSLNLLKSLAGGVATRSCSRRAKFLPQERKSFLLAEEARSRKTKR